jgi:hypothetical protein
MLDCKTEKYCETDCVIARKKTAGKERKKDGL